MGWLDGSVQVVVGQHTGTQFDMQAELLLGIRQSLQLKNWMVVADWEVGVSRLVVLVVV